jgi:hypothetical protein
MHFKSSFVARSLLISCPIELNISPSCMISDFHSFHCEHCIVSVFILFFHCFVMSTVVLEQSKTKQDEKAKDGFNTEDFRQKN